jgi:thiol:disulfide interchange protein
VLSSQDRTAIDHRFDRAEVEGTLSGSVTLQLLPMSFRSLARISVAIPLIAGVSAFAQLDQAVWSAKLVPQDVRAGESAQVVLEAKVKPGWHIYSMTVKGGPLPTVIKLKSGPLKLNGAIVEPKPAIIDDANFGIKVGTFEGVVRFGIPVEVTASDKGGTGVVTVRWQACSDTTCTPPVTSEAKFDVPVGTGAARPDRMQPITAVPPQERSQDTRPKVAGNQNSEEIESARRAGLAAYLWLAVLAGLGALLTPCVFPMVPITVSYFSKRSERKLVAPAVYCLGIVSTFTVLGVVVSAAFGGSRIQSFAQHPVTNIALAALFVVLALNLFGAYEIRLPSWLLNRASAGSRGEGLLAPFMMGLAFSLTTFTCTVGFVGALLAAAAHGDILYPVLGMLAFSAAFAIPFFLLAVFPQYLSSLPKAGSWMLAVKAAMGFIEIAAAVKFLSNADLAWQLGWLTQPVFLAIWGAIFLMGGLYLLGWFRLPHDEGRVARGPARVVSAAAFLGVGFICLGGIASKPSGEISAFLPPEPYPGKVGSTGSVLWQHEYAKSVELAKQQRPLFINFTGVNCTNCRWMENNILNRPDVTEALAKYVPVELWTDRVGDEANAKLQLEMTGIPTLPLYVIVSPDGEVLRRFEGSTRDPAAFLAFLQGGGDVVADR